ncbi:MAG: UvrD-helicase domain-containing protein [Lamprobacter sp.]|uniref:UvrD-helicase domain-containing protein n=1 Tax=Lamprobacter sp. TaxID=3100796 RepID=UPI002B25726A|nr:UvrD-helicase domain-containing protein [Lamprobacter sp.]MEA3640226.1 UvrD-helicase domain-containing protein [Lamprobacter sp.]
MQQDPRQQQVATMDASARQLVLAGPGTGKTETVALRLSHLLDAGLSPAQILVLSFSRSAVRTVADRLERFADNTGGALEDLRHIAIRTFDSWSFRLLRQLGDQPKDLLALGYEGTIDRLTALIASERRTEIHERLGAIRHIIVDEFQDLSGVRGRLVLTLLDMLAPPLDERVGFTILGDEAQSIYGFALRIQTDQGLESLTTAGLLNALRRQHGDELIETELETNHRAVPGLARASVLLRAILRQRTPNIVKLEKMQEILKALPAWDIQLNPELLQTLDGHSTAILTRTNGEAIRVWQRIMGTQSNGPSIPVMLYGANPNNTVPAWVGATLGPVQGSSISRQRFGKVYQYLYTGDGVPRAEALVIPDEETAWKRLLLAAQLPDTSLSLDLDELRTRIGWPDMFPDDQAELTCPLSIMNVHQSKGREFNHVSLLETSRWNRVPNAQEEILEEASVIFVAFSRAEKTLRRIASTELKPMRSWTFQNGTRKRWGSLVKHSYHEVEFQLEMGLSGDVAATSFIDTRLHETESAVADVQTLLAENPAYLIGRKVLLCRIQEPGCDKNRHIYVIHLDENGQPGEILGAMSRMLTFDLLDKLKRQFELPVKVRNLRITEVVTFSSRDDITTCLATPWGTSGFWLGVNIYGVGEFVPRRKLTRQ